ncbi:MULTISPECIES: dATP/dGTP pyrophosphohydrolase domain-containing protein [unclassified Rhodococcus (in: high G+C Gram-positive bacteria)]|uniref:dATP/dGTP pyrophosphohydrolase domain-containing protein n=1 Tax=unclassified Rhodococcus (in: high G+C Gram-positive bacteria) TaxID=192944 RepID=UPI001C3C685D|nr:MULTISPECIES: dATP/dGTP pyrophosphohydrolase domain-containing protein [unclassified Rhodococcus (in: high G+C Gram-positive bacteria)]
MNARAIAEIITDYWPHRMSNAAADAIVKYVGRHAIDPTHLARQRSFSLLTFGPGKRTEGVLDHITKEIAEVRAKPDDISEWADLAILTFDGALRQGFEPEEIIAAIKAKQEKNEGRTWPDWRTMDPNRAIEHVRDGGAA